MTKFRQLIDTIYIEFRRGIYVYIYNIYKHTETDRQTDRQTDRSLNSSWQSKYGVYCALGMAGIEPTLSKSEIDWTPLLP
jgi:hypothetical protein